MCTTQTTHKHTGNTTPSLWIRTHHITAVYLTPQTLNNFNFYHFIIINSYPVLFYVIFQM